MNTKALAIGALAVAAVGYLAYDVMKPKPTAPTGATAAAAARPGEAPKSGGSAPVGGKPAVLSDRGGGQVGYARAAGDPGILSTPREAPRPAQAVPPPESAPRPDEPPIAISVFGDNTPRPTPAPAATPALPVASATDAAPQGATRKAVPVVSETFLPIGEMVKCRLVMAVSSEGQGQNGGSNGETPVIGMVEEDKYFNGQLLVPRGTKVHGTVGGLIGPPKNLRLRTGQRWTLVFPQFGNVRNGSEITIRGIALHRSETGTPGSWAIADGDGGLRGLALYDPTADRIQAALATFLAAGVSGLQNVTSVANGLGGSSREVSSTPRNAALGGVSAVAAGEVARIQEEIRQNSVFLLVPSGTTFYLYLQQTVDIRNARVGDSAAFVRGAESDFYDQFGRRRDEVPETATGTATAPAANAPGLRAPVAVPSAYGRGPYNTTRPAQDEATAQLLPPPR